MNGQFLLKYTVFNTTGEPKPQHKQLAFESESDLLAASDEGMCKIYDELDTSKHDIIFRSVELTNAKEVYDATLKTL